LSVNFDIQVSQTNNKGLSQVNPRMPQWVVDRVNIDSFRVVENERRQSRNG